MTRHQEPMTTRSTALLQQIEGGVLGRYRSCLFSGHDTPPAQLTLPLPSVYHLHSQFATLEKKERTHPRSTAPLLAKSPAKGESLVGAVDSAAALLEGLVRTAPAFSASAVT